MSKNQTPQISKEVKTPLALNLLNNTTSTSEIANNYYQSVKYKVDKTLEELINQERIIDSRIFDLTNFSLETNLNAGIKVITREETETRFEAVLSLEYEKE